MRGRRTADDDGLGRTWRAGAMVLALAAAAALTGGGCGHRRLASDVPRFAYVLGRDGAVGSYAVDAASGLLRPNGYVLSPTPVDAVDPETSLAPPLAVSPSGFIYLVAKSTSSLPVLATFAVDAWTGVLTPLPTITLPGPTPSDIVAHPGGNFVYVVDQSRRIQANVIDRATGALLAVGAPAAPPGAITSRVAIDPGGRVLLIASRDGTYPGYRDSIVSAPIDPTTGQLMQPWSQAPIPFEAGALAVHPSGRCGIVAPRGRTPQLAWFSLDAGGAPAPGGNGGATVARGALDVAVDPGGKYAFVLDRAGVITYKIASDTTCALEAPAGPVVPDFGPGAASASGAAGASGAASLSVDPSGRFVYVSSPGTDHVAALAVDRGSGALTGAGSAPARAGLGPFAPVFVAGNAPVDFQPKFLYAANSGGNDISVFAVDGETGTLALKGNRSCEGYAPVALATDSWGRFLYVANRDSGTVTGFVVNPSTGALGSMGDAMRVGARPVALTVDPAGRFLFVSVSGDGDGAGAGQAAGQVAVFAINQRTGQLAGGFGSPFAVDPGPASLAVDPTGSTLYVTSGGQLPAHPPALSAFRINEIMGALAPSARVPIGAAGTTALGADVAGAFLFLAEASAGTVAAYPLSGPGGALADRKSRAPAGAQPISLAVDPLGRYVYAANRGARSLSAFTLARTAGVAFGDGTAVLAAAGEASAAGAGGLLGSVVADPSGHFVYAADEAGGVVLAFTVALDVRPGSAGVLSLAGSAAAGSRPVALAVARRRQPVD